MDLRGRHSSLVVFSNHPKVIGEPGLPSTHFGQFADARRYTGCELAIPAREFKAAHFGVRTATHKLIDDWKQDACELFALVNDPTEQRNLLFGPSDAWKSGTAAKFVELKAEVARLQKEFQDDGQYADPATWPKGSADGPFDDRQPAGTKTVAEAIGLSVTK